MTESKLIQLEYYDPKTKVRLLSYTDKIIFEWTKRQKRRRRGAIRQLPEIVRGMSGALYDGRNFEFDRPVVPHGLLAQGLNGFIERGVLTIAPTQCQGID